MIINRLRRETHTEPTEPPEDSTPHLSDATSQSAGDKPELSATPAVARDGVAFNGKPELEGSLSHTPGTLTVPNGLGELRPALQTGPSQAASELEIPDHYEALNITTSPSSAYHEMEGSLGDIYTGRTELAAGDCCCRLQISPPVSIRRER